MFICLLFTKSRSGLLAFGVSSIVFWSLYLWKVGFGKLKNYLLLGIWILIVATLSVIFPNPIRDLIFKPQPASTLPLSSSSTQLETGGTESGYIRKIVWTGALRIWQASSKNWWIGTGPETFAMAYYQFRPIEHNLTSEWELLYNKAHNEFLNYLATTGLLGLLSYLALLFSMVYQILSSQHPISNRNKKPLDTEHWILNIALLAGWLTLPITNFWGFSVVVPQLLLFLLPAITVALTTPEPESKRTEERDLSKGQILSILIACFSTLPLLYSIGRYWLTDIRYAAGINAYRSFLATQNIQYLIDSYQQLTKSFTSFPREPNYASELGTTAAYLALALSSTNATSAASLANLADQASLKAIALSPQHPNFYKSYARTAIILSEINPDYLTKAYQVLLKAQTISPTDPRIPYHLGILAQHLKNAEIAKQHFQKSLDLKPDFPDPQKALDDINK